MSEPIDQVDIHQIENLPEQVSEERQIAGISRDKLNDLAKKAWSRLNELKANRISSMYEENKQKDFMAYHMIPPPKPLPYVGYPNMACPLTRIGVDTFHSNVMFTFGGQEGTFNVLPDFLSRSHMDVAKRAAAYMTYVLNYECGLYTALDKASMDSNTYENGFLKARYVIQEEWVTRTVKVQEVTPNIDQATGKVTRGVKTRSKKERIKKTIFDGVKVERIAPQNILASPFFETVQEAVDKDYLFELGYYNHRFIEERTVAPEGGEAYFDKTAVAEIKETRRNNVISRYERNKQVWDGYQVDLEVNLTPVELAEAHFREDIDGDGIAEKVALVFETETGKPLRISFAECRIVKLTPRPVDGRWEGESIRKAASTLITEWEAIHNQRVAKGQWSNLPFFFYKSGGRFNPQIITLSPGKGYPMDSPSDVNFPQPPPPDPSYFNEEKMLLDYFDRILGLGDVIQGQQRGVQTATGIQQTVQRAGIRLASPINRYAFALEELLDHIWDLNVLCAPEVKEFRVAGVGDGSPVFDKMTRTDYDTQVAFKLYMATLYDVQQLKDSAMLNYRTALTNPLVMQDPGALYDLTKQTFDALGLKIRMHAPEQANAKGVFEVIDLLEQGKSVEPTIGIDPDEHLTGLQAFFASDEFDKWTTKQKADAYLYYDKVQILKQTLRSAQLNNAGQFPGMPPMQQGGGVPPTFTANRNPTQKFNTQRVSNSPQSMRQNLRNPQAAPGGVNVVNQNPQVPPAQ